MISERNRDVKMQSTIVGQEIQMAVDVNSMEHIMGLLTDLYSDPEQAVIREYSTNAHDAHVEAGVTRPIEVTTPTPLSPFLRIKDYGIGLDVDGIARIYSQYGASTKRGTNAQNGMLGLGCKSALTYSDQFSLVARKDGVSHTVSITRDEQGRGTMTVVESNPTDEPNGVEVVIPVKRHNDIASKAKTFYSYWPEGTVLLNGEEPEHIDGLAVSDNMLVVEGNTDYVVMGNVAYPTAERLDTGLSHGFRYREPSFALVAFVSIGEVVFTPSREALQYTQTTNATLERVQAEFKVNAHASVQREMDKAETPAEAVDAMCRWSKMLATNPAKPYTYKGKAVPLNYEGGRIFTTSTKQPDYGMTNETSKLHASEWSRTLFVGGFMPAKLNKDQKAKVAKYAAANNLNYESVAFCIATPILPFLAKDQVVDYEETIKPIKLNPVGSDGKAVVRIPGSFDVVNLKDNGHGAQRSMPANDIDQSRPIFYSARGKYGSARYTTFLSQQFHGCYVVSMGSNRVDKFLRNFPKAKTCEQGIKDAYAKWLKTLTPEVVLGLAIIDAGAQSNLRLLDARKVDDPAVKAAIKAAQTDTEKAEKARSTFHVFRNVVGLSNVAAKSFTNPLDNYPLVPYALRRGYGENIPADHAYLYMNAVYAANATTKEVK